MDCVLCGETLHFKSASNTPAIFIAANEIELNEKEVVNLLKSLKYKYATLALYLDVPYSTVKGLEKFTGDCGQCLYNMLEIYLREKSPSVDSLCQAMEEIEMKKLSDDLRKKYQGKNPIGNGKQ